MHGGYYKNLSGRNKKYLLLITDLVIENVDLIFTILNHYFKIFQEKCTDCCVFPLVKIIIYLMHQIKMYHCFSFIMCFCMQNDFFCVKPCTKKKKKALISLVRNLIYK